MRFVNRSDVRSRFEGKTVALVGSGPGSLDNAAGVIDAHDLVVRVNNYRLMPPSTGVRTDVFYSFFGNSIRKSVEDLKRDGVTLCLCKCPDAATIESDWHRRRGKLHGVDFRWIYEQRRRWWFCDTYVPSTDAFLAKFSMLGRRVPTTGFAAIIDVLGFNPRAVYLTGFDFFRSGIHNVSEPWRDKNNGDPIGHVPDRELAWLANNLPHLPVTCDPALTKTLKAAA